MKFLKMLRAHPKVLAVILVFLVVGAAAGSYFAFFSQGKQTPKERLARCLSEKGVSLYGMATCPHCQEQKDKFGTAVKHLDYVDCLQNQNLCKGKGIEVVPTWIIDGTKYEGVRDLSQLAEMTGCEYSPSTED